MKKYLKYYFLIFKMCAMDLMIHRANYVTWAFVHLVSFAVNIAFFKIVYSQISSINGWTIGQVLMVMGVSTLIGAFGSLTFFPFFWGFSADIRNGDFDLKLIKPIDVHFQSAIQWIDLEDMINLPLGIGLIIYSLAVLKITITFPSLLLGSLLIICSLLMLLSLATLILSTAFRFVRTDAAMNLFWSVVNISRFPAKAIKGVSQFALILLIPVALITSVPAEVFMGKFDWPWIIGSLVSGVGLFAFSRYVFMSGIKRYSSASS